MPPKLPETWLSSFSIVGNETPRAASFDAKVRRRSWSCHSRDATKIVKHVFGFPPSIKDRGRLAFDAVTRGGKQVVALVAWDALQQIRDHSPVGERVGPLVLRHGRRQSDRAFGCINPLPPERCNLAAALPGQDQQCNNLGERRRAFECRPEDSAEFVIRKDTLSWKTFDRRKAFAWTLIDVAVPNGPLEKYLCGHEGMVLFRGYRLKLLQLLADVVACDLRQVLLTSVSIAKWRAR
jgi:hypothetical protein